MNPKFLLITAFSVVVIILLSGCINEEKTKIELGEEILNIGHSIPDGWNHTIITHNLREIERPHGLWEPAAIVDFNLNKETGYSPAVKNDKEQNISLRLYFYNITEKQEIMEIIDQQKMLSWCIPTYFSETGKYIIVTSPCYINRGHYSFLEQPLKEYLNKYNVQNSAYEPGIPNQTGGGMSFEESIERGLNIKEKVELTEDEKVRQSNLIANITEEVKQEFNTKNGAWKETWDDPNLAYASNPRMFAQSKQYKEFLSFCREQDKAIWPLLFQEYEQGDDFIKMAIIDLTYNEYGSLLDEIRQESARERYTAEGAYIAPSERANVMKYIKRLLALI
ncbi:MAG: hypothetical protein Q8M95_01970 [Candidatus Methanoperedens sp.]|nr:hypothetical protein [Candidatus Methanoperedens sp.]